MKEATGYEMDPFFRPPKGEYSERTLQITKNMGYTTIFWSLAYPDYDVNNQPGADYVIERFDKYIHPGGHPADPQYIRIQRAGSRYRINKP